MCCKSPISEMGPEAMDFVHGGWTMSHAVGTPKPWKKRFLVSALKGISPTLQDSAYWKNVDGPIHSFSNSKIRRTKFSILLATFIGRFYRKN